jgi:hypothetical protein
MKYANFKVKIKESLYSCKTLLQEYSSIDENQDPVSKMNIVALKMPEILSDSGEMYGSVIDMVSSYTSRHCNSASYLGFNQFDTTKSSLRKATWESYIQMAENYVDKRNNWSWYCNSNDRVFPIDRQLLGHFAKIGRIFIVETTNKNPSDIQMKISQPSMKNFEIRLNNEERIIALNLHERLRAGLLNNGLKLGKLYPDNQKLSEEEALSSFMLQYESVLQDVSSRRGLLDFFKENPDATILFTYITTKISDTDFALRMAIEDYNSSMFKAFWLYMHVKENITKPERFRSMSP